MPRRILLGCFPSDSLSDVRAALEASGHDVLTIEDVDGILEAVRARAADLIILGETLDGGTGIDVLSVLDAMGSRPLTLFLGDDGVPGADAVASNSDIRAILSQAEALLGGRKPVPPPAPPPGPFGDDTMGWSVKANALSDVPRGGKAAASTNGKRRKPSGAADRLEVLLRRLREADYYEILGLPPSATDEDVREAHAVTLKQVRELARESSLRGAHLEEMEAVLAEALDVLGEPALRAAYTRNRL